MRYSAMSRLAALTLPLALIACLPGWTDRAAAVLPGRNGRIAYMSDRDCPPLTCPAEPVFGYNFNIYAMNPDGTGVTRLTDHPAADRDPVWSPDGGRIAFFSGRDNSWEIYVMDADGSGQTRLTNNPAGDVGPAWSPDGTRLAFHSDRDGNAEIYAMNADGTAQTRLTNNPAADAYPAWSPDGTKIAFYSVRDGNAEIYSMNADGSGQTRLTNNPATDALAAWSPDGTKVAFYSLRDGNAEVYVMNADGSGQTRLTNHPAFDGHPAWSPDGLRITFGSDRTGNMEVYVMNADGSSASLLTARPCASPCGNQSSPDWQPLINHAPVARDDNYTTDEDVPLTVEVANGPLANDSDADGDPLSLTWPANVSPSHGGLAINSNGAFTYTPDADFNGTDFFTYTVTDGVLASDVATVTITIAAVNDDTTPPVVIGTPNREANTHGWYDTDVTIDWGAVDPTPSSGPPTDPPDTVAATEGTDVAYTSEPSCDPAGNCATGVVRISLDDTDPTVKIDGVTDGATYTLGAAPAASCITTDALSGVASVATPSLSGGTPDGVGALTATCTGARDLAGNTAPPTSSTYTVQYAFSGFLPPIDNPPTVNTGKAGRTYPIKWQLTDAGGDFISNLEAITSLTYKPLACGQFTGDPSDAIETTATGGTTLRYDAPAHQFIFNWATPATPGCYELFLTLTDGTVHPARFSLT